MKLCGFPSGSATYVPSGRLWPSGDFSLGSKKIEPDSRVELNTMEFWHRHGALSVPESWGVGRYGVPIPPSGGTVPSDQFVDEADLVLGQRPLDLTDASNPHKPSNRPESYGRSGITGYGRKMIKSACTILERVYKGRLTFATVTMPTLPPEQRRVLAERWPEFVRQLLQWLSRCLERGGLPKAIASVTEIQPRRLQAGNGGYLHLHLVWPNQKTGNGNWAIDVQSMRAWCDSFLARSGLWVEGSWVNVDTKLVAKSAAAYLSKYMTKGGDTIGQFVEENGWPACPGQWWNMSKAMRDKVKSELLEGIDVGRLLDAVVAYAFDCSDFDAFWYLHHVDMEYEGRFITVGWFGAMKPDVVRDLVETIRMAAA